MCGWSEREEGEGEEGEEGEGEEGTERVKEQRVRGRRVRERGKTRSVGVRYTCVAATVSAVCSLTYKVGLYS